MHNNNTSFYVELELFIVLLNSSSALKCNMVFNSMIKVNIESISENDSDKCICIVENLNGTKHRCTRSKKFGDLCGLHFKRKNSFKTIYNDNSNSRIKHIH